MPRKFDRILWILIVVGLPMLVWGSAAYAARHPIKTALHDARQTARVLKHDMVRHTVHADLDTGLPAIRMDRLLRVLVMQAQGIEGRPEAGPLRRLEADPDLNERRF